MSRNLTFIAIILLLLASTDASGQSKSCSVNGAIAWYPILYREDEQAKGLAVDILRSYEQHHDVSFQIGGEIPWIRIEDQLAKGTLDLAAGAFYAKRRADFAVYSNAFFNEEVSIFVAKQRPFSFTELPDLIGRSGMRPASGSYGEKFDNFALEHLEIQGIFGTSTMFRMLLANRGDYVILAKLDGQAWLKKLGLQEEILPLPKPVTINDVHFLLGKNGNCIDIFDKLNAHILSLKKSAAWQEMLARY